MDEGHEAFVDLQSGPDHAALDERGQLGHPLPLSTFAQVKDRELTTAHPGGCSEDDGVFDVVVFR